MQMPNFCVQCLKPTKTKEEDNDVVFNLIINFRLISRLSVRQEVAGGLCGLKGNASASQ